MTLGGLLIAIGVVMLVTAIASAAQRAPKNPSDGDEP